MKRPARGLPPNAVQPRDRLVWRRWLDRHHARHGGVWLVTFKKSSGRGGLTYSEAVEEALCFGWIDSKPSTLDAERTMLWFGPRRPRSAWARSNKERVARLIEAGKMAPAGLAKIEAARRDGSWNSGDAAESLQIPRDLATALRGFPNAKRHWDAFPPGVRRGLLFWVGSARRPETRARRVAEIARSASRNIRANEWRPKA